jgi:hypothetical protein
MDNLESAIADLEEQIAQLRARRAELDKTLRELESQRKMMAGEEPERHHHRCPHCGALAACPQAYGEDCPLEADAPADCRNDPYRRDDFLPECAAKRDRQELLRE